ncbi:MAG: hypothetical protein CME19_09835 [Gemmatimonadetes bacterium]|nr:hypothetical protein [Gemmatimonadota bacterium]
METRPNILWISTHDTSAGNLGCYGDSYADTPNLDRLAEQGVRYTHAFTASPICSPSRTSIYTGMHPTTLGTHHHRSAVIRPDGVKLLPRMLMDSGYACTKPDQDINLYVSREEFGSYHDVEGFLASRPKDNPFFAYHKLGSAHASVFKLTPDEARRERSNLLTEDELHDPEDVPVPSFVPDTPLFRERMALFYDAITNVDKQVGDILGELDANGLTDSTIVVFWGDHGSGYPRGKVHPYDDGLHIPLIVRFPEQYQKLAPGEPGTTVVDLVMHVDLAPSTLRLVDLPIPDHMQGRILFGLDRSEPREFVCSARDRLDNNPEMTRTIRTRRFRYHRNFMPHQPYASFYPDGGFFSPIPADATPEREFWETSCLPDEQKIHDPDGIFLMYGPPVLVRDEGLPEEYREYLIWQSRKPHEELYDLESDPEAVNNLADDPDFAATRDRLREQLFGWMSETWDLGLLDETEIAFRARAYDGISWEVGQGCASFPRIIETADLARRGEEGRQELLERLEDSDSAVRYWAVTGLLSFDHDADTLERVALLLDDPSISVNLAAANYTVRTGQGDRAISAFTRALESEILWARLRAGAYLTYCSADQLRPMKALIPALQAAIENQGLFGPEHEPFLETNQFGGMVDAQRDTITRRWVLERAVSRIELA